MICHLNVKYEQTGYQLVGVINYYTNGPKSSSDALAYK